MMPGARMLGRNSEKRRKKNSKLYIQSHKKNETFLRQGVVNPVTREPSLQSPQVQVGKGEEWLPYKENKRIH